MRAPCGRTPAPVLPLRARFPCWRQQSGCLPQNLKSFTQLLRARSSETSGRSSSVGFYERIRKWLPHWNTFWGVKMQAWRFFRFSQTAVSMRSNYRQLLRGKNHIRKQGLQEAYGLRSIGGYRKDPAYSPGGYRQESHRAPCWRPKSRRPI